DEKDENKQAGRVDSIRQRRDIAAPLAFGKPVRLPGVEDVSNQQADSCSWKDVSEEQRRIGGDAARQPKQINRRKELHEVIDEQPEKAVEIAAAEVWIAHGARMDRKRCTACGERATE